MFLLSLFLPFAALNNLLWISDPARYNGVHLMGGPGSGKSRLAGRVIAFLDFLRGLPVIIIDPTGGTIDNFLDKLVRLPEKHQKHLWPRVRYVDMSGQQAIVPWPLYYRLHPQESLFSIAQRFLEVVRRMDPALARAGVEGLNAVLALGTYTGMILAALDLQITEAEDLIRHPERWQLRFEQALAVYPEAQPAVAFFLEWRQLKLEQRVRQSRSLLTKILMFSADPTMRAMFGASSPGLDWAQVIQDRCVVLLDFRHELNAEHRRFKLLWTYSSLLEYLKFRGFGGRNLPVSLIIDEISQLLGMSAGDHSIMAENMEELISVVARNFGVWLCLAHQSLMQVEPRIQSALMRMGTQIIGVTPDPQDALYLAKQLVPYEPLQAKKQEPVWMSIPQSDKHGFLLNYSWPEIIDYRAVEFTPEEQCLLAMRRFQQLGRFEFLVKAAAGEGSLQGSLQALTTASIDPGIYPDEAFLAPMRPILAARHGRTQASLLAEIHARPQAGRAPNRLQPSSTPAIMNANESTKPPIPPDPLPTTVSTAARPAAGPAPDALQGDDDEKVWQ